MIRIKPLYAFLKAVLCFAAALLLAAGCKNSTPRLVILHTNDTHSHFEPLRSGDEAGRGGVIERAAFIDSVRAAVGEDRVLLLDAGDFSQGSSYFSELEGQLEPLIINDMRYDCTTLGNHEFDNGIEDLAERLAMLKDTKVVCANLDLSQFELSKHVTPYTIIERGGMKIGIIGLEANLSANVSATISSRIPQLDNVEVVNKWAKYLDEEEECDLVILLSHLGYGEDKEIVPRIEHIDIVIGGHSHTFVDDFLYVKDASGKEVPIITDGCWGLDVGRIDVR